MHQISSSINVKRAAVAFSLLLLALTIPLMNAPLQAQVGEHVHMYVVGGTRTCETNGTGNPHDAGVTVTARFCVHLATHTPHPTSQPVSWSTSSPDGQHSVQILDTSTHGPTGSHPGEAWINVRRATPGLVTITGTWATTGQSASLTLEWVEVGAPVTHHVHLLKTVGGAGGTNPCHNEGAVPPGSAVYAGTGEEQDVDTPQTVIACLHDADHEPVPDRIVTLNTNNVGSASADVTATATSENDGMAEFTVNSPTAGKTQSFAVADDKTSNEYRVTWKRAVDHVHVYVEGQGSCENPAVGTVALFSTATVVACVHGADDDGIPSSTAPPSTGSGHNQAVTWEYQGGPGGFVGTQEISTDANGEARARIRSENPGTATVKATSGGHSSTVEVRYIPVNVTLTPGHAENNIGTTHTVQATVKRTDNNQAVSGTVVNFEAAGTGGESPSKGSSTTNDQGVASFGFSSNRTGVSRITATAANQPLTVTKLWKCGGTGTPYFPNQDRMEDIVLMSGQDCKGWVLDGSGALYPFGGASSTVGNPNFGNSGLAREFVVNSAGTGGYILDGFGALHPIGLSPNSPPPAITGQPYFGRDLARDLLLVGSTSGYILDGFGALHPFGGAPATSGSPYFPGSDIARAFVLETNGQGGYILDGLGALHPFAVGSNPKPAPPTGTPYFGFDIARDVAIQSAGKGFLLDGYGGIHSFGGASRAIGTPYFGFDIGREIALNGNKTGGLLLDGYGGPHTFGAP